MATPLASEDFVKPSEDVYLTIVPSDDMLDEMEKDDDTCDELLVTKAAARSMPAPLTDAPSDEPAPRRRWGMFVAGAMGGGLIVGGGGAAVAVLGLLALLGVGVAGGAWMLWPSDLGAPTPELATLAEDADPTDEVAVEDAAEIEASSNDGVAAASPAARPAPRRSSGGTGAIEPDDDFGDFDAPAPAPVTIDTTKPDDAVVSADEDPMDLGGFVMVKILSDPPAATLFVDGQPAGRTPAKVPLDAGSHTVTLESGKASGTFPIDVGMGAEKFCFKAKGKKLSASNCL